LSAPFPLTCYRDNVADVATTVYHTLLDVPLRCCPDSAANFRSAFTAAVHYAGAWKGALVLEGSMEQAADWAARLLPVSPPLEMEDVRDSLGEIANVIAGNLKPMLPGGVGLSMPSVVQGGDYRSRVCGGTLTEQMDFADESGVFRITLIEVVETAGLAG
jgi:CheY-specific phosphatase CheX